jgi:hypothetical protein
MMADYAFWLAIAFMVGCTLYFSPRIKSDRMAMQWGFDGKPAWYAPKIVGLWLTVAIALAARMLIWAASTYVPERVHGAEIGLLLISIIMPVVHLVILRAAARAN